MSLKTFIFTNVFLNYYSSWRALLTDIIPTSEPTEGGAGGLGVTCGITCWGISGSWTTTTPDWQLAASGALQVLILLSKWSPEGHGIASYFPWLQIKNEVQSFGFGARNMIRTYILVNICLKFNSIPKFPRFLQAAPTLYNESIRLDPLGSVQFEFTAQSQDKDSWIQCSPGRQYLFWGTPLKHFGNNF